MTDTPPNSQLESLVQDVAFIKDELIKLKERMAEADSFTLRTLQLLKRDQETFNLRVARAQLNLFAGVTHSLEHSIEDYAAKLMAQQYGFEVRVVDGKTVLENADSIQVTRVTENTYNYSPASAPDEINNTGTEPFTRYFNENPEVFGDRDVILVNVHSTQPVEVPVNV